MKRIASACALALSLTTIFVAQPAQAAVKCTKVTSVGHTPLKTNPPRTAAKVLPK